MATRKKKPSSSDSVEATATGSQAPTAENATAEVAPPAAEPRIVRKILTRSELDGLARWAAEAKYADTYAELRERDRKTLLARIDPKDELSPIDRALTNARSAKAKAAARYMSIAEAASRRLGVDVTQYAYDDETGLLSLTPIPK